MAKAKASGIGGSAGGSSGSTFDVGGQGATLGGGAQGTEAKAASAPVLLGTNGTDFPPSGNKNHLEYAGGGGLGVWNQLGGGVANGGVDSSTAKEMSNAVARFTGIGYHSIRAAQAAGDTTSTAGKKGVVLEQFIKKAVETGNGWTGGTTYRGIDGISDLAYNYYKNLSVGDVVDANHGGSASWSTNANTAFQKFSGGPNSVVFVHLGNSQPHGVSIDRISTCGGEMEVLVSKDAKFRVQGVAQYKGGSASSKGMKYGNGSVGHGATNYLLVYVEDA